MTTSTRPCRRAARRTARVAAAAAAATWIVVTGSTAWAHVSVTPSTAETGSTTELTFRVPNEEAKAATTRVTIQIPTDHPIAQVLAKPVPGWTVTERTTKLATPLQTDDGTFSTVVSEVTWSGGSVRPGQYQDFSLSADPLPDQPTTLVFKALQEYSNGDVVRWIDVPEQGQPEPEHPAPVVTVTAAVPENGAVTASDDSGGEGVARVALLLALVALLVAALLAGWSVVASRRRR